MRGDGGYVGNDGIARLNVLDLQVRLETKPLPNELPKILFEVLTPVLTDCIVTYPTIRCLNVVQRAFFLSVPVTKLDGFAPQR